MHSSTFGSQFEENQARRMEQHQETKRDDKENPDEELGLDCRSESTTSTSDRTDHRFENFQPHQYSKKIKQKLRRIHALKVGVGVLLASQFALIPALDAIFQGTGVWAVITVVFVILQTPGDTTQKILNRTVGTLIAAVLGLAVGIIGSKLSEVLYPAGHLFVAATNFAGAYAGTLLYTEGGTWSYAFLLGTVTYVFISLSVLERGSSVAIFRAIMITLGGAIGFLVAWFPPNVRASDVARAYLADALLDTSVCAELVVHYFLTGRVLTPIHEIHVGENDDDTSHRLSKMIVFSRVPLEAAISAAKYEGTGQRTESFKSSGLAVRLALRTILSADVLLRQEYRALDQSNEDEEKLAMALTNVVASIRCELSRKVIDLNCVLPLDFDATSALSLPSALGELRCALHEYVRKGVERTESSNVMNGFACHVSFARLVYDSGRFVLDVSPSMIPHEKGRASVASKELVI